MSSASCAISGASARARSISPKPGTLFMVSSPPYQGVR
jgi:hypothetical protein